MDELSEQQNELALKIVRKAFFWARVRRVLWGIVLAVVTVLLFRLAGNDDGLYSPRLRLQTTDDGVYHTKAAMCRTATHKYVMRLYEQDEMYDLESDPLEETNVIDDPALAEVQAVLKARLLRWYMETCDVVPRQTDRR